MDVVGEGLYPSVARLNHSCAPNVKLSFDAYGCCCVHVREGMAVKEGEELLVAYINPEAPREVRRAHLLDRYGFECSCTRCEAGL